MSYPHDFFALHVRIAQALKLRFEITLDEALFKYTPFALHFEREAFKREVSFGAEPVEWAFVEQEKKEKVAVEANTIFNDHQLFGRFYYVIRDGHVVRPHIAPVSPSSPLLSAQNSLSLQADLSRMFKHIHAHCPQADSVLGNSWLYNLSGYRELYPPIFTRKMEVCGEDEFFYLALWGQFYNRNWRIRDEPALELINSIAALKCLDNLVHCFPFQILMPKCSIDAFYTFHSV